MGLFKIFNQNENKKVVIKELHHIEKQINTIKNINNKSVFIDGISDLNTGKKIKITSGENDVFDIDFKNTLDVQTLKPLHDYDLLIYNSTSTYPFNKEEELRIAFKNKIPTIVLCNSISDINLRHNKEHYDFFSFLKKNYIDFDFIIHDDYGNEIFDYKESFGMWFRYSKCYTVSFPKVPQDSTILALNKGKTPIAFKYKNFIFIPYTNVNDLNHLENGIDTKILDRFNLVKNCILFFNKFESVQIMPDWVDKTPILNEQDLRDGLLKIQSKLEYINELKKISYTLGDEYQKTIGFILKDAGYDVNYIEFDYYIIKHKLPLLIYPLSTVGAIKKDKLSKAIEKCISIKQGGLENLKKVIVLLHDTDKKPNDKLKLDEETISEFFVKNNICLIYADKLLEINNKIKSKIVDKDDIIKKINGTSGVLNSLI